MSTRIGMVMLRRNFSANGPLGSVALAMLGLMTGSSACLFIEDFGDLQAGTGGSGATTADATSTSSGQMSTVSAGGGTTVGSTSSTTTSSTGGAGGGTGGAGATTSTGVGGAGGEGPTWLAEHGVVQPLTTDAEDCENRVTSIAVLGDDIFVAGLTTSLGSSDCSAFTSEGAIIGDFQAGLPDTAHPGESLYWWVRYSTILQVETFQTLGSLSTVDATDPAPARLVASGGRMYVAFEDDVASGAIVVRDITDFDGPPDRVLETTGTIRLTDLATFGGRLFVTGVIDGDASASGDCASGTTSGTHANAGFAWSLADTTCDLGTFGPNTHVSSASSATSLTLAAGGALDLPGAPGGCTVADGPSTLSVLDVDGGAGAGACVRRAALGSGTLPFARIPSKVASGPTDQIVATLGAAGSDLRLRTIASGNLGGARPLSPGSTFSDVFATPSGMHGVVGSFPGSFEYERLAFTAQGRAGYLVTFDGNDATSFVLDGPEDEALTATLSTTDRLYVAGQWQSGLGDELDFNGDLLDPVGTAAFLTALPLP